MIIYTNPVFQKIIAFGFLILFLLLTTHTIIADNSHYRDNELQTSTPNQTAKTPTTNTNIISSCTAMTETDALDPNSGLKGIKIHLNFVGYCLHDPYTILVSFYDNNGMPIKTNNSQYNIKGYLAAIKTFNPEYKTIIKGVEWNCQFAGAFSNELFIPYKELNKLATINYRSGANPEKVNMEYKGRYSAGIFVGSKLMCSSIMNKFTDSEFI